MQRPIEFSYVTGLKRPFLQSAVLVGSWDESGRFNDAAWSRCEMAAVRGPDGCPAFMATVWLDPGDANVTYSWGVEVCDLDGVRRWGIMTETSEQDVIRRVRLLHVTRAAPASSASRQRAVYFLNQSRRLGAQKHYEPNGTGADSEPTEPSIQFAVWAPNAAAVRVRVGQLWGDGAGMLVHTDRAPAVASIKRELIRGGYIGDPGGRGLAAGAHEQWEPLPMDRGEDGVWSTRPDLGPFSRYGHLPYMYEVTTDAGKTVMRTDIYSRCQIGSGEEVPNGSFSGAPAQLDGRVGCSVVVDPDQVTAEFLEDVWPETKWLEQS